MIRVTTFTGKEVAVFGLGASGNATVRALQDGGASVAAWDDSEAGRAAAAKDGVPLVDLTAADWSRFAALVLAPGVPLTHPEPHWTVEKAKAAGVEVIGDVELFCRERRVQGFDVPFIAITGTNGKSTTTALIAHVLKEAGRDVQLGGNIGRAVLTLDPFAPGRHYVVECSSFQIDLAPSIDPSVGILLNVTPDHLDRHGTIENYAAVKERLVKGAAIACVGIDDAITRTIAERLEETGRLRAFTVGKGASLVPHVYAIATTLFAHQKIGSYASSQEIVTLDGVPSLRGGHNVQNACAAASALLSLSPPLLPEVIGQHMKTYPGLPHRMEEVGRIGRILFINDSKATNADSTEKALLAFPRDVFWILGGKPKDGGITALEPYFSGISKAYLIGQATEEFAASLSGKVQFERCGTLDNALVRAVADAKAAEAAEPVVLLSPACASYDQYKNFEVRGDAFRKLVTALPGIKLRRGA
jgi:UDP-N-acetylmuramoylalanine--D-glutamate ligase